MGTKSTWTFDGKILVVEDEPLIQYLVEAALREHFGGLTFVENGQEALACLAREKESFEVILTDFSMPLMDGGELIQALAGSGYDIPVVLLTGDFDAARRVESAPGVTMVVLKPFDLDELLAALQQVCEKHCSELVRLDME